MTAQRRLASLVGRLGADVRGNVAMMFAFAAPVLIMMTLGAVDIHRISTIKANVQDALDAAALAAARSTYSDDINLTRVGMATLRANLAAYPGVTLKEDQTSFRLDANDIIIADARVDVKTLVANIVMPPYGKLLDDTLPVAGHSEVNRTSQDMEVALVLDITGSMAGTRLADLKTASYDLIDKVIQGDENSQRINRTRIALVPYSMGVNVGGYATQVRGGISGPTSITAAAWMKDAVSRNITGVTSATTAQITSANHGLSDNDYVWISGIESSGPKASLASKLNDKAYRVVRVNSNVIGLQSWNGSAWTAVSTSNNNSYAQQGTIRRCLVSTCEVVVTSAAHGLATGADVRIANVGGMTLLNSDDRSVTLLTPDTFIVNGAVGPVINQAYSRNGYVQCLELGCQFYKFTNYYGAATIREVSTCVSERVGLGAYSDLGASGAPVGLAYPGSDNRCLSSQIMPLSADREVLKTAVRGYSAVGSTAGQIGVEWGWYMVSPTFGSIFGDGAPDPYDARRVKVVILMTDGEFNTPYCSGVVAGANSGSGDVNQHIRCNEYTGTPLKDQPADQYTNPFKRSVEMCRAMKEAGIIVYTVGLAISSSTDRTPGVVDTAQEVMKLCATSEDEHAYLPENGAELKTAFNDIGQSITRLRISR